MISHSLWWRWKRSTSSSIDHVALCRLHSDMPVTAAILAFETIALHLGKPSLAFLINAAFETVSTVGTANVGLKCTTLRT